MKTESSCSAERRLNVSCDVSDVLFPSQKHESVCVSQPWQVSSSRPCEEEPQPDTIRPPRTPQRWRSRPPETPHTPTAAKNPSHHPRLTQNPSLHHRSLTLHRLILLQSTSSSTLKPPQTSETGSVCGGSTSRQRSLRGGQQCEEWTVGGGGGGLWVLCWVMKQVSLTSEVCGDRTGLRSVWTTVRQEGGVSTGSFCSWHHRGRSQPHWAMSQEGLIRFRLQKQICFRYSVWFFCRLRSPLAYATS